MEAAAKTALLTVVAVLALAASAGAQAAYNRCADAGDATLVEVSAASCDDARRVATALGAAAAGESASVLRGAGWNPLRAAATSDSRGYDLIATRGRASLRIRRTGATPDLDGWMAGRELLFARGRLVGGRPPQPGIVVGRVQRNLARKRPLDALVVPVPSGARRPASAVVNRGVSRPPWFVAGVGRPQSGRRVCFTGRTSGVDRCGQIVDAGKRRAELLLSAFAGTAVRCTTMTAREGDSGGPVYTAPRRNGTVYAVGITTLVVGPRARMCFTPLRPVLSALGATLVTAGAG